MVARSLYTSPHKLFRENLASCFSIFIRLSYYTCRHSHSLAVAATDSCDFQDSSSQNLSESDLRNLNVDEPEIHYPSRSNLKVDPYLLFRSNETYAVLQAPGLQHSFKNWQELRKHKLTASTFAGAIGFWPRRRAQLWLEKLGAIEPFSGNLATCWSNIKEEEALERYKLITGNPVLFPDFQVYGGKHSEDDFLGASPDGIINKLVESSHQGLLEVNYSLGVLEIKCPYLDGNMSKAAPYSRVPLYYIPQAQGLLEIMDRDWMDLYVWTPRASSLFRIKRNVEYWEILKIALSDFWYKHVQPAREICSKHVITNPLFELKSLRPAPRHELYSRIIYESKRVVDSSECLMREINGQLLDG